jgi:hypothetical protein
MPHPLRTYVLAFSALLFTFVLGGVVFTDALVLPTSTFTSTFADTMLWWKGECIQDGDEVMVVVEADRALSSSELTERNDALAGREESIEYALSDRDLLPDLVPLPASELRLGKSGKKTFLYFSTSYYNQGRGALELRGNKEENKIRDMEVGVVASKDTGDRDRSVVQRIYRTDGTYRDSPAGIFLWHDTHLHYHFGDFIVYDIKAVKSVEESAQESWEERTGASVAHEERDVHYSEPHEPDEHSAPHFTQKTTFCLRDVSKVTLHGLPARGEVGAPADDALYRICYKELQGISVGWADTYFSTYPDQNIDVTDFPDGTYRLRFVVDPDARFDELTRANNESSVLLYINKDTLTVDILGQSPTDTPAIEHVYPVQEGCSNCTL